MPRLHPLRGLWFLLFVVLLTSGAAGAQDGPPGRTDSEIGRLILTLQTTDGRPIAGTHVVIDGQAGGSEAVAPIITNDEGVARIPADAFPNGTDVTASVAVRYGSPRFDLSAPGTLGSTRYTDYSYTGTPTVTFSDVRDPACARRPRRDVEIGDLFGGCATSEAFEWTVPPEAALALDVDASCDPLDDWTPARPIATNLVSGTLNDPREADPDRDSIFRPDRFLDPRPFRFPSQVQTTGQRDLSGRPALRCVDPAPEAELPEWAVFGLHGYNLDFEDGAWGIRATAPLPVLRDRNLGAAVGLDFYSQGDSRSTLAVNADVTISRPWPALGDASAYLGVGPRLYVQSYDGGVESSSSSEIGAGAVSGMTYGLGPVTLYGDVGVDYVYDTFVPVTHFGAGFAFSGD